MRASPFEGGDRSVLPKDYSKITKIKLIRHWGSGSWSFKLYNITATEHDPADKPSWFNMSEKEFFPFVDKYGQFKFREWPGKVHSDAELKEAAKKNKKNSPKSPAPQSATVSEAGPAAESTRQPATSARRKSTANGG